MEKLLAMLFLVSTSVLLALGNFWFTYGIWPRSWWSLTIFAVLGAVNTQIARLVLYPDTK